MSNPKLNASLLTILAILSLSTFIPALAYAAPRAVSDSDWQNVNGNSWAWNYSPQTQINKDNVDALEVKWILPLDSDDVAPDALQAAGIGSSTTTPPIVRNGMVYVISSFMRTYAVDAETGKVAWIHNYVIDIDEIKERIPIRIAGSVHKHGFQYWEEGNSIINHGLACDFYGIDADTGEETFWIKDLCKDIPGNLGEYLARRPGAEPSIGIYDKGRQFIYVLASYIHSRLSAPDARHVTMGIDMDTEQVLWRVFSTPPQDVTAKDWALQECDIGFFRDIPCTEVAAVNRAGLEWDWALEGEPASMWGGATANWGQAIVDEDTGIIYTQTGNQGPYSNMSLVPGPRLYGSTIMAIDMNQGKRIWWLQPFPHDPYDYDCNWSGMLVDNPTLGKVYIKGCKEGVLYVMDAATGEPKYKVDAIEGMVARGQIGAEALVSIPDGVKYYPPDPKSFHDMREWNWISYPAANPGEPGEHCTLPCTIIPYWYNGLFATDMSFDPENQAIIHYESAMQVDILQEFPYVAGESLFRTRGSPLVNTTIVARDLVTGNVKWTYFTPFRQRAALVVTGGMVFSGFPDGMMRFLDKNNGLLLREMNIGASVVIAPTIGKDSAGNSKIFTVVGLASPFGGSVPGTLMAIGLSERAAAEAKTVTTTVTTTSRTTLTTTSTTTSTTTATTTQTVTSTTTRVSTTTATSTTTLSTTSTVVSTAAPSTTTVTSEITETTGLPTEVTYAAVAVAVIAIIAAAVLATRRR